ncbi:hypothetical protein [Pseudobacteroides cellulosolvens]|uniref:Uncharacterized protein n=1 Tax=Pseudobacteroides cellulosolvens ATCC 35603 = DSM 2933 TaxID=398512 RepID=A0A0L6JWC3_9FIRM|nr:hypothetical protein [Pseudobacteroides cellulosolvens]KNY30166.1 hypothetical protein Bccel_5443 [Pseudobacteroides cellulosolvens ATCC 35603 = DSM 2933]
MLFFKGDGKIYKVIFFNLSKVIWMNTSDDKLLNEIFNKLKDSSPKSTLSDLISIINRYGIAYKYIHNLDSVVGKIDGEYKLY